MPEVSSLNTNNANNAKKITLKVVSKKEFRNSYKNALKQGDLETAKEEKFLLDTFTNGKKRWSYTGNGQMELVSIPWYKRLLEWVGKQKISKFFKK